MLEACVVLAAGSLWAGSWTQKMYGTGSADIWEVSTVHEKITQRGFEEGWMVLEPTSTINDKNYIDVTLVERSPRLVVVETPSKVWSAVHSSVNATGTAENSARQKAKRVRESSETFLAQACAIADKQVENNSEFVLELPLDRTIMRNPHVSKLANSPEAFASNGYMCGFGMSNSAGERIKRPTLWLTSSVEMADQLKSKCGKDHCGHCKPRLNRLSEMPDKAVDAIFVGFTKTMCRKDPRRMQRLRRALDARIRGTGMFASEHMVNLAETLDRRLGTETSGLIPGPSRDSKLPSEEVYAVVDEKTSIPVGGIEFDIPEKFHSRASKSLLDSVRRLHFNSGHPPNSELERIVRLAGGSDVAQAAVRGLRCSVCKKAAPPKPHKPGRVRDNVGVFNDTVLVDLAYIKDSDGVTHTWMIIIDEGTD